MCAGGEDLPRVCGEAGERPGRHTHLSAAHVVHAQRGAVLPAVLRGGVYVRAQDGGGIPVSVCDHVTLSGKIKGCFFSMFITEGV